MAKRPDVDTGQLQKADKLMSDIVSKFDALARLDELPAFKLLKSDLDDVDKKLAVINKAVKVLSKDGQKQWKQFTDAIKANRKEVDALTKRKEYYEKVQTRVGKLSEREKIHLEETEAALKALDKEFKEHLQVRKALLKLAGQEGMRFLDWFGGSVTTMSFSTVFAGMKLLATGIEKVYDLQEKWTHAIGTFRKSIGPATKESKLFEKVASDMHFTLFELGMGFEAAHVEMANFVKGFGFANDEAKKWAKQSVEFGVVTGGGTEAIAELSRNMMLMGLEASKQKGYFTDMIAAANAAGVSVADFTKEIVGSKDALAEFGPTGQKMFMTAASWAKKLGVSIKSLQNIIKLTDTFSSTAEAAAKMNTVFGTSINSMDLMLEQDPAKRFNMLRDALIGAGKDMKNLSRLERKLIGDTLGLSMEETNAMLKSGQSYEKFMADKQEREEEAAKATANMNKLMSKAATTMLEWGAVAERMIRKFQPFVDAFLKGLGPEFENIGKSARSFAKGMENLVDQIIKTMGDKDLLKTFQGLGAEARKFFTEVFTKENIKSVVSGLSDLFNKFSKVLTAIADFAGGPGGKFIAKLIEFIGQNAGLIALMFGGSKLLGAGLNIAGAGAQAGGIGGGILKGLGGAAGVAGAGLGGWAVGRAAGENVNWGGLTLDEHMQNMFNSIGKIFGGPDVAVKPKAKRGAGGPVSARTPYTVGEEGIETFVPQTNGTIVPNGGGFLPVTLNLRVMLDSREIQRMPFNTTLPVNVSVVGA